MPSAVYWLAALSIVAGVMFTIGQQFGRKSTEAENAQATADLWRDVVAELRALRCDQCGAPLSPIPLFGVAGGPSHATEPVHGTAGEQGAGRSHRHPLRLVVEP